MSAKLLCVVICRPKNSKVYSLNIKFSKTPSKFICKLIYWFSCNVCEPFLNKLSRHAFFAIGEIVLSSKVS